VPAYPIEADKLLDAADRLAPADAGRGRPSYAAHRRAVSTAYYAAFHAITARVAALVFPNADTAFQQRVRRWVNHADIRTVCEWVSTLGGTGSYGIPKHIVPLLNPPGGAANIDPDTVAIADGFLELHEKREQADYDHEAVFTRTDTLGQIALARQVAARAEESTSDEVLSFFGLIAMRAQARNR
jgi:hypothetical protein